jgi:hypothetical protein
MTARENINVKKSNFIDKFVDFSAYKYRYILIFTLFF